MTGMTSAGQRPLFQAADQPVDAMEHRRRSRWVGRPTREILIGCV
jgi:hypothetical protein